MSSVTCVFHGYKKIMIHTTKLYLQGKPLLWFSDSNVVMVSEISQVNFYYNIVFSITTSGTVPFQHQGMHVIRKKFSINYPVKT